MSSLLKLNRDLIKLIQSLNLETQLILLLKGIKKGIPLEITIKQKNSQESMKLRCEADHLFHAQKGNMDFLKMHKMYSQSISLAKPSSKEEAQAYANRSAILFNMLKYKECINDINRALSNNNYSNRLKLLQRKMKCLKRLLNENSENLFENTSCWLKAMSLKEDTEEELQNKIDYVQKIVENQNLLTKNNTCNKVILPKITHNKQIPCASDAVDIKYSDNLGRYLVANRDIGVGEIIIIEEPYVKILSRDSLYTHCSHCFLRTWESIPCKHCIYAMYCSNKCRTEAWQQYHDIECNIIGYFEALEMDDFIPFALKLTILAVREAGSINNLRQQLKKIDNCKDYIMKSCSEDGVFYSNNYIPVYNLTTHKSERKQNERLTPLFDISFVLFQLLTTTTFFQKTSAITSDFYEDEDVLFIGTLMNHHRWLLQTNAHEFGEFKGYDVVKIGASVYAISSLINHSCNANVNRCPVIRNSSAAQIIFALQPLKAGDQILDDYGANFASESKAEREKLARYYFFECNCKPCIENWPMIPNLSSITTMINDKKLKKVIKKAIFQINYYKKVIHEVGFDNYKEDKFNILVNLANIINIFCKSVDKPNVEYSQLLGMFYIIFTSVYGNKFCM